MVRIAMEERLKGLEGLQTRCFSPGERICCAVSGGADSVALLCALREANQAKESPGLVLRAVHVHHGLRGAEADGDEQFVRELCARFGVDLRVERVDTPARQVAEREGVEEAARQLRYAAFWRTLGQGEGIEEAWADTVVTAHTLDDQAETVLMKLLRGAWTEGLAGTSPVLRAPAAGRKGLGTTLGTTLGDARLEGGRIVRPLLGVRRAAVEAFLRERGQAWREDSSNKDLRMTRNRLRHEVLPLLRTVNPAADEALGRMAAIAQDEELFWQTEIARLLPGVMLPGKPVRGGGRAVSTAVGEQAMALDLVRLKAMGPAVRRRVVRAAALQLGVRLSAEETGRLLALAGLESSLHSALGPSLESILEPRGGVRSRIGARLELRAGLRAERSARELQLSRSGTCTAEDVENP